MLLWYFTEEVEKVLKIFVCKSSSTLEELFYCKFFDFITTKIFEMKNMKQLVCPISDERVNEHVTRINAFWGVLMVVAGFVFNSVFFFLFLLADFYIRAFTKMKFSPISFISHSMANAFNLSKKSIDKAPKIFAARLGFLMTLAIIVLYVFQLNTAAIAVGGILVFFATLEFVLAVCMGCIMYTYLILPFYK